MKSGERTRDSSLVEDFSSWSLRDGLEYIPFSFAIRALSSQSLVESALHSDKVLFGTAGEMITFRCDGAENETSKKAQVKSCTILLLQHKEEGYGVSRRTPLHVVKFFFPPWECCQKTSLK